MPRGDRTGPRRRGPGTGRQAGYCAGHDVPGYLNDDGPRLGLGQRRGFRGGAGNRRGHRHGRDRGPPGRGGAPFHGSAPVSPSDEIVYLEGYARELEDELATIRSSLEEVRKVAKE